MRVLLKLTSQVTEQNLYLVAGKNWGPTLRRVGPRSGFLASLADEEHVEGHYRVVEYGANKSAFGDATKDVQWLDVPNLSVQMKSRLLEIIDSGHAAGTACGWANSDSVPLNVITDCFREIANVLPVYSSNAMALCRLMLFRTRKALCFRNVGMKPYTTYHTSEDMGYVRMKNGPGAIDANNVDQVYEDLVSATKWYARQHYHKQQNGDNYEHDDIDHANPYATGLIHYRIVDLAASTGVVDITGANLMELVFTYVHETSHAWANTRDNYFVADMGPRGMYLRKWVTSDIQTVIARAKEDPVRLLTSADFVSYVILRTAGKIQPAFLDRVSIDA